MNSENGKWLISAGVLLIVCGLLIYFFHDKLNWLGRLPGDIRIENENMKFYFPLVTCLVMSLIGSLVIYLIRKFF